MIDPYIGVTGFMQREETLSALTALPPHIPRRLMVGVLASSKTVFLGQPNKWPNRYPPRDAIADIFVDDPRALNLIHYSTDEPATLVEQLTELVKIGGPNLQGFQLNMTWPLPRYITTIKERFPNLTIVLQIGARALQFADGREMSPTDVVAIANGYRHVDFVLLDRSGGYGKPLAENTFDFVQTFYRHAEHAPYRRLQAAVAGGLSADTLGLVAPILQRFPDVSIDAESRLRDQDDHLDLRLVHCYIDAALAVLGLKRRSW